MRFQGNNKDNGSKGDGLLSRLRLEQSGVVSSTSHVRTKAYAVSRKGRGQGGTRAGDMSVLLSTEPELTKKEHYAYCPTC